MELSASHHGSSSTAATGFTRKDDCLNGTLDTPLMTLDLGSKIRKCSAVWEGVVVYGLRNLYRNVGCVRPRPRLGQAIEVSSVVAAPVGRVAVLLRRRPKRRHG